jgi:hypothetical protein
MKDQVGQMVDEVASRAAPVVDQAQEKASQVLDQAQERATTLLEVQKERAVDGLDAVVHAAHQTGQQLRGQGQEQVARYADQAAHQAERLSGYLRAHEVEDLFDEAESFARRQPQLFLAGGVALGLIAARFFKSSARHRSAPPNAGAAMARTGAYGGNFGPGSGQAGLGGQYRPATTTTPPSYASVAPGTPSGSGGVRTGTSVPSAPPSTPPPFPPSRPSTEGGLESGRRA